MYIDRMARNFKCSKETLAILVADVDISALEVEENSALEYRVIDPPVLNGITLTEHPNKFQREKYRKIYNNGGCIVGAYVDGIMKSIITTINGEIGKSTQDFENIRLDAVRNNVARRIEKNIDHHFENGDKKGKGPKRPKNMTPADFWAQFSEKEFTSITLSLTPVVMSFVESVNEKTTVVLKSAPIQEGITMLNLNELLSNQTFTNLTS